MSNHLFLSLCSTGSQIQWSGGSLENLKSSIWFR